jgi:dihydrofolate synthase/folylpolyglutamate synthase
VIKNSTQGIQNTQNEHNEHNEQNEHNVNAMPYKYYVEKPSNETQLYAQAMDKLKDSLRLGIKPTLENATMLAAALGNPQNNYCCIQIAGTNGKSSTSRFTAAFLAACNHNVGLYTSPELMYYEERIEINGKIVSRKDFASAILTVVDTADLLQQEGKIDGITEFEILTVAALWLFAKKEVDYAVLEVGLGGRWDATSIVTPKVAVVTGIDLDHTNILGNTVEEIAAEKAAIIKAGSSAILGVGTDVAEDVFKAQAKSVGVLPIKINVNDIYNASITYSYYAMNYQAPNIACALAAAKMATENQQLDQKTIQTALNNLVIPGRFEILRHEPILLIDAAHNPQAARYLAKALQAHFGLSDDGRLNDIDTLLLGILADKDASGIIDALAPFFRTIIVCASKSPRALPADNLAKLVLKQIADLPFATKLHIAPSVSSGLEKAAASNFGSVATGSITVAGEAKLWFLNTKNTQENSSLT